MQTRIKLNPLYQSAEDLKQIKKGLDGCRLELEAVRRDLAALSSMDFPLEWLRNCEERLEGDSGYCALFGNVAIQIARLCIKNENKLIDRSESMRRRAAREAYVIIDLTKYMQMYQKIFAG